MPEKAKTLQQLIEVFQPSPLDDQNWNFWQDTDKARETQAIQSIIMNFKLAVKKPSPVKILFCGHRGCGKSTELNRIRRELSDIYEICQESVLKRYPLHSMDHRLLLFFCSEILLERAEKLKITLDKDEKSLVLEWFDEKSIEHVKKQGYEINAEAGGEIKILNLIKACMSGKISRASETREISLGFVLDRIDRYMSGLLVIRNKIQEKSGKPLLLIIEDLDKIYDLEQARKIFIENSKIFGDLPFHAILTFPIGLWYDPKSNLQADYDHRKILPMIPVSQPPKGITKEEGKDEKGRQCLEDLFFKRVEKSAKLISHEALHTLIVKSGGVLRDFGYIIRESALFALIGNSREISQDDINKAVNSLRIEYENFLGEFGNFKVEEIMNHVDQFKSGPLPDVDQTEVFKHLLQNLCILEYNGERWYDLHPLIREYMEKKKWIGQK